MLSIVVLCSFLQYHQFWHKGSGETVFSIGDSLREREREREGENERLCESERREQEQEGRTTL